jgi:general secretion pathway protein I
MRAGGFTLLEVVVALLVLGFALAGGLSVATRSAANAAYLHDRVLAHWVAMNAYNELQLATEVLEPSRDWNETMLGRPYRVKAEAVERGDPPGYRMRVEVAPAGDPDRVLETLAGDVWTER